MLKGQEKEALKGTTPNFERHEINDEKQKYYLKCIVNSGNPKLYNITNLCI